MKKDRVRESPARRLGILYVASFFTIALLSGISQAFILREVSWQSRVISSVAHSAGQRSFDHPLGVFAMSTLAASEPGERVECVGSLRSAIQLNQRESSDTSRPGAAFTDSSAPDSRSSRLHREAETHRQSAIESAQSLVSLLERQGLTTPRPGEAEPFVRRIIAEEEAFRRVSGDAAQAAADDVAARTQRIESIEFQLFGLVAVVLVLEGLFVVNPVILKIQQFMRDISRSHEELKFYAKKLERSNKELQDFASVASHDLQEPLRKIHAFSDRLRSRCAQGLDDQGRDYLDRIQNAAGRMHTLINDLLTYARVATKAKPFVTTDLVAITREVVSDLEARIEQVNGRVEVGELPSVEADPLQVRQLMQNLIGNSLKYHRPDVPPVVNIYSHHLTPGPSPTQSASGGPYCQILVEDNGIGFDEIYADKIFTIFQRLHGRTEYEGTGVGLAVCRKIVERHGGTITARSAPGKGSTFMVTLPVRQPKEVTPDERES
ncbi:MAG: sensor histidine kinase [Isosphaeraceae bacterium]